MDFFRDHQISGYHPLSALSNFFSAAKGSFREPRPIVVFLPKAKGKKGRRAKPGFFLTPRLIGLR
jgi:hypothetical protein